MRVFGPGLNEDRDIGIGVLPKRKEIPVSGLRPGLVSRQGKGTAELQAGQCADRIADHDARMFEDLLKFRRCVSTSMSSQVSLP